MQHLKIQNFEKTETEQLISAQLGLYGKYIDTPTQVLFSEVTLVTSFNRKKLFSIN